MRNNKRGVIKISKELIENENFHRKFQLLFSRFIPLKIIHDSIYWTGIIEYYGISEYFETVEPGCITPEYMVEFTDHKDEPLTIKFIKL